MPVTVTLPEKKIILEKDTSSLLSCFTKALENEKLNLSNSEQGPQTTAAPSEEKNRTGFWSNYVLSNIELLTGVPHGAKEVTLHALTLELDAPAEVLLRAYLNFLNTTLITQGFGPKETEAEIRSKYVLMHELLYRLVSIALSTKLDKQHDGDSLLSALRGFINNVKIEGVLVETRIVGHDRASSFLKIMGTVHEKWIGYVAQMVGMIKLIHSNTQAISETLNQLRNAENTLKRQLIAYLDPNQHPSVLNPNWLDHSLRKCEALLIHENITPTQITSITRFSQTNALKLTPHQQTITAGVQSNGGSSAKSKKVAALYDLHNETRNLLEIFAHLDLLFTYTSWVPILGEIFDFEKLTNLLDNYASRCETVLTIPPELEIILNNRIGLGLIRYHAASPGKTTLGIKQSTIKLNDLQDDTLRQEIGRLINSTVFSLLQLQGEYEGKYHFIRTDALLDCGWLPASESKQTLTLRLIDAENRVQRLTDELHEKNRSLQTAEHEATVTLSQYNNARSHGSQAEYSTNLLHALLMEEESSTRMFDILLNQNADLAAKCSQASPYLGTTALHIAASTGNHEACVWLLNHAVEVNIPDARNETPLDKAVKRNHPPVVRLLRSKGGATSFAEGSTQDIHRVIAMEAITDEDDSVTEMHMEALEEALNKGADINGINKLTNAWNGDRPLHTLLVKGNQKLIQWAMANGADPNLADGRRKETPLQRLERVSFEPGLSRTKDFLAQCYSEQFPAVPKISIKNGR